MKIMVLSWPMRGGAGAEKVLSRLTFAIEDSIDFVFVHPHMDGFGEYDIPFKGKQIEVDIRWHEPTQNFLHRIENLILNVKVLKQVIREEDPDLILSNSIHIWHHLIVALKLTRLTAKKIIIRFGNPLAEGIKKRGKLYTVLMRFGMERVDRVIVPTRGVADEVKKTFHVPSQRIDIINNPIPLAEIRALSQEEIHALPFSDDLPIIINVARLDDQKNQSLLIRAFQKVQQHVDANLAIIGTGPREDNLRRLVHDLNLGGKVHFLGWQDNPFKYMRKADLFVLSSNYEGFGNVIVEAMACGCPIITTDCPYGPLEILGDGEYGVLVPVGEEERLTTEIVRLLRNEELRQTLVKKGKQRASKFDAEMIADQYARVFHELGGQWNGLEPSELYNKTQKV